MSRGLILTIERVLDDARFLDEALAEAQETHETSLHLAGLHLEDVEDAVAVLGTESVEAVLLGVHDGGREAFEAFLSVRSAAPQVPVIAVVDRADRDFARTLLRQGAQDYLVRGEFDYIPLARALENSIARHRVLWAAQNSAMFDAASGFLNARGFAMLASHCRNRFSFVVLCDVEFGDVTPDARDLMLLECTDILRLAVREGDLIGRLGPARFGILARELIHSPANPRFRFACVPWNSSDTLESALAASEKRLCENRLAYRDHPV